MSIKTEQTDLKRFVTIFSTEQAGRFKLEFREITADDIYTVASKEATWEEASSAISKFMHGGNVDLSQDLFSIQATQRAKT